MLAWGGSYIQAIELALGRPDLYSGGLRQDMVRIKQRIGKPGRSRKFWKLETGGSNPPTLTILAGLAQLVEHLICNQGVRGSSPLAGTIYERSVAQPG